MAHDTKGENKLLNKIKMLFCKHDYCILAACNNEDIRSSAVYIRYYKCDKCGKTVMVYDYYLGKKGNLKNKYYEQACRDAKEDFFLCGIQRTDEEVERSAEILRNGEGKNDKLCNKD